VVTGKWGQFALVVVCAHFLHGGWQEGCCLGEGGQVGVLFEEESWEGVYKGNDKSGGSGHLHPVNRDIGF
jgi:hypothetical protein